MTQTDHPIETELPADQAFPSESIVSEDELIRQAMAADPDGPIDPDATPLFEPSPA